MKISKFCLKAINIKVADNANYDNISIINNHKYHKLFFPNQMRIN